MLGVSLLALLQWDILLTLLHPSARGPFSYRVNRLSWLAVRRLALLLRYRRLLTFAGPFAFAMSFLGWVLGFWLGFAAIYLPLVEGFSYESTVPFGERGVLEALYVSGTALTTVGYGDVVASSDWVRLLLVFESACGFGVFTAAVSYIVSVYPLVTGVRSGALRVEELGATRAGPAARVITQGGPTELSQLQRSLIENDENTKRFPILYYFESGDQSESLMTLLRAGVITTIVLRFGVSPTAAPEVELYGPALETTLWRLMEDYERTFVGGRTYSRAEHRLLGEEDLLERLGRLRSEVEAAGVEPTADHGGLPDGFGPFVSRAEAFLSQLAYEHCNDHAPLLCEPFSSGERARASSAGVV